MPWNDWQFWVVTAVAIVGLWLLLQPFLSYRRRGKVSRASLTVGGKPLAPRKRKNATGGPPLPLGHKAPREIKPGIFLEEQQDSTPIPK